MKTRRRPLTRPRLEVLEGRHLLATFTVTSPSDSGPGTLRQAILDADAVASNGPGRIVFHLPTNQPSIFASIDPLSELPAIGAGIVIDATTQPGYSGAAGPKVAVIGGNIKGPAVPGHQVEGLVVAGDSAGVIGLRVSGFAGDQVLLAGQHDLVQGDVLGDEFSSLDEGTAGLSLLGSGQDSVRDNLITEDGFGIFVGPGSSQDVFQGNFVQYNSYIGLYSVGGTGNTIGSTTGDNTGNQFTNNGLAGVVLADPASPALARPQGNTIAGNYIADNGAPGGTLAAVDLLSSSGNTIGGTAATASNHIVDNLSDGIQIGANPFAASPATASGNLVRGNLDGGVYLQPDPKLPYANYPPFGNHGNAVVLGAGSSGNTIASNDLGVNGGAPVVDNGKGNTATGNSSEHDEQRQVDFGVTVQVSPTTVTIPFGDPPFHAFAAENVEFTVFNRGPGYAGGATVTLDFSAAPGLQLNTPNFSSGDFKQISPTKILFGLTRSDHYIGAYTQASWLPNDQASSGGTFLITGHGPQSVTAIVSGTDSFDSNPTDKVYVLKFNLP